MKITISGSMHFAQDMLDAQAFLQKNGHQVLVPLFTDECVTKPDLNSDFDFLTENDCMMDHFRKIQDSEAVLVINNKRRGISGYIGGSTLMEIGIAKFLGKKIYILNELPDDKELPYIFEVKLTRPVILNSDLSKIV